jgi:hypothetical protein
MRGRGARRANALPIFFYIIIVLATELKRRK